MSGQEDTASTCHTRDRRDVGSHRDDKQFLPPEHLQPTGKCRKEDGKVEELARQPHEEMAVCVIFLAVQEAMHCNRYSWTSGEFGSCSNIPFFQDNAEIEE